MKGDIGLRRLIPLLLCVLLIVGVAVVILIGGDNTSNKTPKKTKSPEATNTEYVSNSKADSSVEGVITRVNTESQEISIFSTVFENTIVLNYTGGTRFYDRYNIAITQDKLYEGMMVKATYESGDFKMVNLKENENAWEYLRVKKFNINLAKSTMTIGNSNFKVDKKTVVVSEGVLFSVDDIASSDVLNVRGIGNKIWSIEIVTGHGYLTLKNVEKFDGGKISTPDFEATISENLRITMTEGVHEIKIIKGKQTATQTVEIKRNDVTLLDLDEIATAPEKTAEIEFDIEPSSAILYINNEQRSYRKTIELSYGTYKIRAVADGYNTYEGTIKVDNAGEVITIKLKELNNQTSDDKNDSSDGDEPSESKAPVITNEPSETAGADNDADSGSTDDDTETIESDSSAVPRPTVSFVAPTFEAPTAPVVSAPVMAVG